MCARYHECVDSKDVGFIWRLQFGYPVWSPLYGAGTVWVGGGLYGEGTVLIIPTLYMVPNCRGAVRSFLYGAPLYRGWGSMYGQLTFPYATDPVCENCVVSVYACTHLRLSLTRDWSCTKACGMFLMTLWWHINFSVDGYWQTSGGISLKRFFERSAKRK